MELKGLYEKHIDIGSVKVLTCFQDVPQTAVTAEKGQPCIHAVWKAPAGKVATVDAFWAKHEAFMRSTHGLGASAEEGKAKLTSFHIAKGPEMEDALADPAVPTGNEIYFMSEVRRSLPHPPRAFSPLSPSVVQFTPISCPRCLSDLSLLSLLQCRLSESGATCAGVRGRGRYREAHGASCSLG